MIFTSASEFAAFTPLERLARPKGVLMCPPDHFDVVDVRNVHMEGHAGTIDHAAAQREWEALAQAFRDLGLEVATLDPVPELVDMVFTANPTLSGADRDGNPFVVISRMRFANRQLEVAPTTRFFERRGVAIHHIPPEVEGCFEGGGDSLWHPDRWMLWCGTGPRSDAAVFPWLSQHLDLPIALVTLNNPAFYHLDTCLMPLDADAAAFVRDAFDDKGLALLKAGFERLIEVDPTEAAERLAGNFCCPDGKHVLLPADSPKTRSALELAGYTVHEVDTDEFLKSGGSAFCLTQELY